jgi:hypothetical protein
MKTNSLLRIVALLAAIAVAVPAFAKPFSRNINLVQAAKLGKAELQAGEYRLQIDGNKSHCAKGPASDCRVRRPLGRPQRQVQL